MWEYNELVASFIHWATNSKSRKMSITLMVTGSSECAKEYTRKFKKQIESQVLQIVFLGDGGFFSVMPIVQKVIIPGNGVSIILKVHYYWTSISEIA